MKFLIIILAALIVYYLITFFRQKAFLKVLTQNEFIEGYRKAQLIDVREQQEFDRGHIRGARNIPLTQMKQNISALRPDKPVYLYCQKLYKILKSCSVTS